MWEKQLSEGCLQVKVSWIMERWNHIYNALRVVLGTWEYQNFGFDFCEVELFFARLSVCIATLWLLSPKHMPEFECQRSKKIKAEYPLLILVTRCYAGSSLLSDFFKADISLYLIILWIKNVCRAPWGTSFLSCVTIWSLVSIQSGLKFKTVLLTFLMPQPRRVVGS